MRTLRLIASLVTCLFVSTPAFALSAADQHSLNFHTEFYWPDQQSNCGVNGSGASLPTSTAAPSELQIANAKIIIGIAKTENLGQGAAVIGVMVGLDESSLLILANSKIPLSESNPTKQGDGNNGYSLGVFQQQITTNWSTISTDPNNKDAVYQLMDPAYAAEAFFGSPAGANAPSALSKGLQNIGNWQSMLPWEAAQKVQASGTPDGSNYRQYLAQAQALVGLYYDSSPAVALPVPFNAPPGTGTISGTLCSNPVRTNGCVNPFGDPGWGLARTDMGVDFIPNIALPVLAICDGTILATDGGSWPGGVFIYIKLSSGPFAGKCTYVAEHLTDVLPVGTQVTAGQKIATALPGYPWTEWGWAKAPRTPSAPYDGAADGTPMPGGKAFARFLRALGAKTLQDPGEGPLYDGGSCP